MSIDTIKHDIIREIARLQRALAILSGDVVTAAEAVAEKKHQRERISEAGRQRIAEAQRKRWQKIRKQRKAALMNDVKA